jgi:hypothetical protein
MRRSPLLLALCFVSEAADGLNDFSLLKEFPARPELNFIIGTGDCHEGQ